jgi:FKBP-type peptidyl-prolyl cis-trans isomerase FkpA
MSTVTAVPIPPVKRSYLVWLWIGVALAIIAAVALVRAQPVDKAAAFLATNRHNPGVTQTASGLQYQVLKPGTGTATPTDDDIALITYTGTLTDGTVFDQSQQPTPVPVSPQGVQPGFSEALKLMRKGAEYRIWMPPALAYGDKDQKDQAGHVKVPGHSVLVFDVNMLDWKSTAEIQMMQQLMQQRMQQAHPGQAMPGQGPGGMPQGAMPPGDGAPDGAAPGDAAPIGQ